MAESSLKKVLDLIWFWTLSISSTFLFAGMFHMYFETGHWFHSTRAGWFGIFGSFMGIWLLAGLGGYFGYKIGLAQGKDKALQIAFKTARILAIVFGLLALAGALLYRLIFH